MKKIIALLTTITALSWGYAQAEFDPTGWFSDISTHSKLGFETENIMFGKSIGEKVFLGGVEASIPAYTGSLYAGITGFMSIDPARNAEVSSIPSLNALYARQNDAGSRFEVKAGYMMDLLCLPTSQYFCTNNDVNVSLDVGYKYYWWVQRGLANPWNQVNRSNEAYIGFITDGLLRPAAYAFYDFNLEQVRGELSIGHTIPLCLLGIDNLALDINAYIGCLRARTYNGDQRPQSVVNQKNSYTYGGASIDLVYALNDCADIRLGARWAGNNDGKSPNPVGYGNQYLNQGGKESRVWWGGSLNFAF